MNGTWYVTWLLNKLILEYVIILFWLLKQPPALRKFSKMIEGNVQDMSYEI